MTACRAPPCHLVAGSDAPGMEGGPGPACAPGEGTSSDKLFRKARTVLSIVARTDFDEAGFAAWLKTLAPIRRTTGPTLATLAIDQNRRDLLVALFMVLSTDRRDLPGLTRARTLVFESLRGA